jgi:hypothetical protein
LQRTTLNPHRNAAVRAARCLFLPALLRAYRAAALDVRADAGENFVVRAGRFFPRHACAHDK